MAEPVEMNAGHAIRRLEAPGFTHQQATGVVEVVQGEVIEKVATREFVGERIALVRRIWPSRSAQSGRISPRRQARWARR
jgi:hypothetical protein